MLETEGIWADHLPALEAFLAVATQWRIAQRGDGRLVATGLDYAAARAGLDLAGIEMTPPVWADLRSIEQAAKAAMNEG